MKCGGLRRASLWRDNSSHAPIETGSKSLSVTSCPSFTEQLLAYVRMHPEDKEAFHLYMDRLNSRSGVVVTTDEELESEMRKQINQSQLQ